MRPGAYRTPATVFLVPIVLAVGGSLAVWRWSRREQLAENERAASAALKTLTTAEADFRSNDRDGNKINDFWTGDVAGLYYLPDPATPGSTLKLIVQSVADADPSPAGTRTGRGTPYRGYWFVAMPLDEYGSPYAAPSGLPDSRGAVYNNSKFAFCAYPADYPRSGRWTFIVNEGNTIFKIDTAGKPVRRFPLDSKLKFDYSGGPDS